MSGQEEGPGPPTGRPVDTPVDDACAPRAYRLPADAAIPNHPHWPALVYEAAVPIAGDDPARAFEALFARNQWPPAWRNGVYAYPHFHTTAHEALGIYAGEVTVQVGGEGGVVLTARAGDVLVLPAGAGHRRLASRGALGVVGAYPRGQNPDLCRPCAAALRAHLRVVCAVACPPCDPVLGEHGALLRLWAATAQSTRP